MSTRVLRTWSWWWECEDDSYLEIVCLSKFLQYLHQYKLYKFLFFSSKLLKFLKMLISSILSTRCTILSLYFVKVACDFCTINSDLAMNWVNTWHAALAICSHHLIDNILCHQSSVAPEVNFINYLQCSWCFRCYELPAMCHWDKTD